MAAIVEPKSSVQTPAPAAEQARPQAIGGLAFDWLMVGLSTIFLGGLYLDGWAHNHGKVDQSFFTPVARLFLCRLCPDCDRLAGDGGRELAPRLHAAGGAADRVWTCPAGFGHLCRRGVGDLIWHTLFGIEESFEALVSPTHLMLGVGLALIVSGPLRGRLAPARRSRLARTGTGTGVALPAHYGLYLFHDVLAPA